MTRLHSGLTGLGLGAIAVIAVLAACGPAHSPAPPTTAATASPTPTPTSLPTPSPTTAPPAPLVVTSREAGPSGTPWTAVQLSLVGEDGTVEATYLDVGGPYGDSYAVGSDHVYFIDGTVVKAMARDGTVTDVGYVPQVSTTATDEDVQSDTALAVSPDESTLVFGMPIAIQGDNGATSDRSQLWSEPLGGTTAAATMVYNDANNDDQILLPFAWSSTDVWVSQLSTSGLGGAGPFLDYSHFDAATFDPATHVLKPLTGDCVPSDDYAINSSSPNVVCHGLPSDASVTVELPSGTRTVTMQPASAAYGSIRVSDDGRCLAYGAYVGVFGNGHYNATVVDLTSGVLVSTVQGYTPMQWLNDDQLVVSPSFAGGATYLLSPSFDSPVKLSSDQPTGALP